MRIKPSATFDRTMSLSSWLIGVVPAGIIISRKGGFKLGPFDASRAGCICIVVQQLKFVILN